MILVTERRALSGNRLALLNRSETFGVKAGDFT